MIDPKLLGYKKTIIYVNVKRNKEFLEKISSVKDKVNYLERLIGKYDYRLEIYYKDEKVLKKIIETIEPSVKEGFAYLSKLREVLLEFSSTSEGGRQPWQPCYLERKGISKHCILENTKT